MEDGMVDLDGSSRWPTTLHNELLSDQESIRMLEKEARRNQRAAIDVPRQSILLCSYTELDLLLDFQLATMDFFNQSNLRKAREPPASPIHQAYRHASDVYTDIWSADLSSCLSSKSK